jgi:inosine-uridine nucleoside N-ribohydrolase
MSAPTSSRADILRMLEPPTRRPRVVLDTDAFNEIDDQFAIVQALLSADRLDLQAIYAAPFPNARSRDAGDGMELSHAEILRLLDLMGRSADGFVHRGVRRFVGPEKAAREGAAVDDLIARARQGDPAHPLYVVAIAAISNVASALLRAPDIVDRIVVVWLGGHAFEWPDTREFNLRQDIGGAQVLFDCGVPVVLLPCRGVVSHLHASIPEIERYVEPCGAIGRFLAMRFKAYCDDPVGWSKEIWDMAAVAWLIDAAWTPSVVTASPVLTDQAMWSFDRSRHPIRYVTRIDRNAIMRDFYRKLAAHASARQEVEPD